MTKQKSSENKTGTKSSAPAVKKNLTVETDNFGATDKDKNKDNQLNDSDGSKSKDDILDKDDFDEDDDLARADDQSPMTRKQLEQESSNSVENLDRNNTAEEGALSATLSSSNLKQM